jgi:ATP synthase protein I
VKQSDLELLKLGALLSTAGAAMVIATFLGLALGVWLDRRLGTSPCFTLGFLMIGVMAGFWNLWKLAKRTYKR